MLVHLNEQSHGYKTIIIRKGWLLERKKQQLLIKAFELTRTPKGSKNNKKAKRTEIIHG